MVGDVDSRGTQLLPGDVLAAPTPSERESSASRQLSEGPLASGSSAKAASVIDGSPAPKRRRTSEDSNASEGTSRHLHDRRSRSLARSKAHISHQHNLEARGTRSLPGSPPPRNGVQVLSPKSRKRHEEDLVRAMNVTTESQPALAYEVYKGAYLPNRGELIEESKEADEDELEEEEGNYGPTLGCSLGSGETQLAGPGPETQKFMAARTNVKRKRNGEGGAGTSPSNPALRTVDESALKDGPQPNENAHPTAGPNALVSPTVPRVASKIFAPESSNGTGRNSTQNHPASSSEVQQALVPAARQVAGNSGTRSPRRYSPGKQSGPQTVYQTGQSSPDPSIDSGLLAGNHRDGNPLQSTCPTRPAAPDDSMGGISPDVSDRQPSEAGGGSSTVQKHSDDVNAGGSISGSSGPADFVNGIAQRPATDDDDDDRLDFDSSESTASRRRFTHRPAANVQVSRSSARGSPKKQSIWESQEEEDELSEGEGEGGKQGGAPSESARTPTPRIEPTALERRSTQPDDVTPKASLSSSVEAGAQVQVEAEVPQVEIESFQLPSLGSSIDPAAKRVRMDLDEDDDSSNNVTQGQGTLLGIAGPESSQTGEVIEFQATQLESSESHPGGFPGFGARMKVRAQLPPSMSSPISSPDRPLATSTARQPVQESAPSGEIVPDSASSRHADPSPSLEAVRPAASGKGKGRAVEEDPSVIEETRVEDSMDVEPQQQAAAPERLPPPAKRRGRPRKTPIVEEAEDEQETNYEEPPNAATKKAARAATKKSDPRSKPSSKPSSKKSAAPVPVSEAESSDDEPMAATSRGRRASKAPVKDPGYSRRGQKRPAEDIAAPNGETDETNYDEPPVAADQTTSPRKRPAKAKVPTVVIPPAPPTKRARKMTTKLKEAAETSVASSRKGGPSKASAKGKGKARQEEVQQAAKTGLPSSPLTELTDLGGAGDVTARPAHHDFDFAVPDLPASARSVARPDRSDSRDLVGTLRVLAYWTQDHCWYPGTVVSVSFEGAEVEFDDACNTFVPLRNLRRCELRPGDEIVYIGGEPDSQVPQTGAAGAAKRRSSKLPARDLKLVIRVEREMTGIDATGTLERDDIVVVCGVGQDPKDPRTHKQRLLVEAISVPSTNKTPADDLEDRMLPDDQLDELRGMIEAQRKAGSKRAVSMGAPHSRRVSSSSSASASTSILVRDRDRDRDGKQKADRRKSLPMPPVPRKASKPGILPSGSPTKGNGGGAQSKLLRGIGFLVTHIPGASSSSSSSSNSKTSITSLVRSLGGTIIDDVNELFVCDNYPLAEDEPESQSTVKIGFRDSEAAGLEEVVVLAEQPVKSFKFLMGLALGIPCVSSRWLKVCLDENRRVDWTPFMIGSGFSAALDAHTFGLQARIGGRAKHDLESVALAQHELKLMRGSSFVCVCAKGSEGREYGSQVRAVLTAMGAERVETTTDFSSLSSSRLASYTYVLFRDAKQTKTKSGSKVLLLRGNEGGPRVVDFEWVKQCLIAGRKLEAKMWAGEASRALGVEAERAKKAAAAASSSSS